MTHMIRRAGNDTHPFKDLDIGEQLMLERKGEFQFLNGQQCRCYTIESAPIQVLEIVNGGVAVRVREIKEVSGEDYTRGGGESVPADDPDGEGTPAEDVPKTD